jgi:hypothetical protein
MIMKLVDKVMVELQKLGLLPQKEEFGIVFKYQMVNYIYLDNDDEEYIKIYIPSMMNVDDDDLGMVLTILNSLNNKMKVIKFVVADGTVWSCYEMRVHDGVSLGDMIEHAVDGLYMSYLQFNDLLKGLVKAMSDNSELN